MGARTLGRVRPNGVIAAPILSDPPLLGKGPFMLANITPDAARSLDPTEARRQRGLAIAEHTRIEEKPNGLWSVPSQTGNGKYWVRAEREGYSCTCADYE